MNKQLGPKIKELRSKGFSYREISEKLSCSKGTVCYHIGNNQKNKTINRMRLLRSKEHPYKRKIEAFSIKTTHKNINISNLKFTTLIYKKIKEFTKMPNKKYSKPTFTIEDVINKFGENPKCYLTGDPINIYETSSYHFDHILPRSKGGNNSIENLGICTKEANMAKSNLTLNEFIKLCQKVIDNQK